MSVGLPLALPYMVEYLQVSTKEKYLGYVYTAIAVITTLIGSIFYYRSQWLSIVLGMEVRCAMMFSIYEKALKLSKSRDIGKIINLYAADSQLLFDGMQIVIPGIVSPLQFVIGTVVLGVYIHWYCLIALAVFLISLPFRFSIKLGRALGDYRLSMQQIADQRLKYSNELFLGIRIVKYYAWERAFMNQIINIRESEVKELKSLGIRRALVFLQYNSPVIATDLIFVFYTLYGPGITAVTAFLIIALMNLLRVPFRVASVAYLLYEMNITSILRTSEFLLKEEGKS